MHKLQPSIAYSSTNQPLGIDAPAHGSNKDNSAAAQKEAVGHDGGQNEIETTPSWHFIHCLTYQQSSGKCTTMRKDFPTS
jgi:hypothetical protein